ncbi:GntR family transcriptional regulator [Alsobacter sp. SYSU M60028]|uniref:GntR family transcriptional regulator n=1 Tax=Alsobacter ponti TaxID=2962936 RepID=A0ABT1LDD8_9HYPH|nr:GntR family transcriptional regulator [Alsobacter ponti]MCP8939103.1 GntR family transcriptional regulator [Alsobacter ponti]
MVEAVPSNADTLEPLNGRKTLVEQVVDRIVEAAARGTFLPGDRVVEAEVARRLQVSRVPVREALRLLESQGIVENMPYRGMRLMDVSVARLEKVLKVRLVLEQLAAEEARQAARKDPSILDPLVRTRDLMEEAARQGDRYELARLDTVFHRQLCGLTGNEVLLRTWEPLSLQLTIIFGLSAMQKDLGPIADEHTDIIEGLRSKDAKSLASLMREHIVDYTKALDHEGFIERMRVSADPD